MRKLIPYLLLCGAFWMSFAIAQAPLPSPTNGGGGSGGTCGALGGDLSGTCAAATVAKVNGASIPTSKSFLGSNSSGQFIAAASPVLSVTVEGTANQIAVTGATCTGVNTNPDCVVGFVAAPVMPNGSTGTSQACADNSTKLDTTAYADVCHPHVITFPISGAAGAAISTGALKSFPTAEAACTIYRTDISADQSGSITIEIWKHAAGTIPTSGDKISASAPITLSSAQLNQNGSISGWTTSVAKDDIFGGTIVTAATVTVVTAQIWCR